MSIAFKKAPQGRGERRVPSLVGPDFAVASNRSVGGDKAAGGERTVAVLSPFDMSVTLRAVVDEFMQALQHEVSEQFLRSGLLQEWRDREGVDVLPLDRCAGTTVPAYYGGELALRNLENNDLDAFLTCSAELWRQSRTRVPGSPPPILRMELAWRNCPTPKRKS